MHITWQEDKYWMILQTPLDYIQERLYPERGVYV